MGEDELIFWGYKRMDDAPAFTDLDGSNTDFYRKYYNQNPPSCAPRWVRILNSEAEKRAGMPGQCILG